MKSSCLTVTEKDKFNERERERKMQSRNLKTNAEEEYSKILDRQSKRRKSKDKLEEDLLRLEIKKKPQSGWIFSKRIGFRKAKC